MVLILCYGTEKWTPSFGQFSVTATLGYGFITQAASGHEEARRSPGLRPAPSSVYASSGIRSSSDECGRRSTTRTHAVVEVKEYSCTNTDILRRLNLPS